MKKISKTTAKQLGFQHIEYEVHNNGYSRIRRKLEIEIDIKADGQRYLGWYYTDREDIVRKVEDKHIMGILKNYINYKVKKSY